MTTFSFYASALENAMRELMKSEITNAELVYRMSQIGKTIKKVTVEPEAIPVPPKTMPAPVEEPVKTPA